MIGAYGMDNSFYSSLAFGMQSMGPDMKPRIEAILNEQFRSVKKLLENNKEAVIAIAEALILRNELTDIDVNEILARVEAEHPFVNSRQIGEDRPFGLLGTRALPEPMTVRRNGRHNGTHNGNGKSPEKLPEILIPSAVQPPSEPHSPSAELDVTDDKPGE